MLSQTILLLLLLVASNIAIGTQSGSDALLQATRGNTNRVACTAQNEDPCTRFPGLCQGGGLCVVPNKDRPCEYSCACPPDGRLARDCLLPDTNTNAKVTVQDTPSNSKKEQNLIGSLLIFPTDLFWDLNHVAKPGEPGAISSTTKTPFLRDFGTMPRAAAQRMPMESSKIEFMISPAARTRDVKKMNNLGTVKNVKGSVFSNKAMTKSKHTNHGQDATTSALIRDPVTHTDATTIDINTTTLHPKTSEITTSSVHDLSTRPTAVSQTTVTSPHTRSTTTVKASLSTTSIGAVTTHTSIQIPTVSSRVVPTTSQVISSSVPTIQPATLSDQITLAPTSEGSMLHSTKTTIVMDIPTTATPTTSQPIQTAPARATPTPSRQPVKEFKQYKPLTTQQITTPMPTTQPIATQQSTTGQPQTTQQLQTTTSQPPPPKTTSTKQPTPKQDISNNNILGTTTKPSTTTTSTDLPPTTASSSTSTTTKSTATTTPQQPTTITATTTTTTTTTTASITAPTTKPNATTLPLLPTKGPKEAFPDFFRDFLLSPTRRESFRNTSDLRPSTSDHRPMTFLRSRVYQPLEPFQFLRRNRQ